jgi:hypothetical protein
MIAKIKEGGEIVTERLFVGHSPYINKPDFLAGFFEEGCR